MPIGTERTGLNVRCDLWVRAQAIGSDGRTNDNHKGSDKHREHEHERLEGRSGGGTLPQLIDARSARLIVSLDGYVDHEAFAPGPALFHHFIEEVRGLTGSVYGRRMYEVMRYWDEDHPEWTPDFHDFAAAWRSQPKWVVSRSLKSVGPNATLVGDDVETVIRGLKDELAGEIEVAGPALARSLTELGLLDEYRLYLRPVVLGRGKPFFAAARPPLRLVAHDLIGEDAIRLTYVPA